MYDPILITMLERNVKELQEQLRNSHVRIKQLNDENYKLRRALNIEKDGADKVINGSNGVWLGDAEMPDSSHLKKWIEQEIEDWRPQVNGFKSLLNIISYGIIISFQFYY